LIGFFAPRNLGAIVGVKAFMNSRTKKQASAHFLFHKIFRNSQPISLQKYLSGNGMVAVPDAWPTFSVVVI
jgi:hypothetical protein